MLKKNIESICNRQVEREGYSSNLYLAMATWAETNGMAGVAAWLYAQADEEKEHMLRFMKYINERGSKAIVPAFKKPPEDFKDLSEMFDEVLKHEQYITGSINEIVEMALAEKDYSTNNFLQWFVSEQLEEESSVQLIVDKLKLGGKNIVYQLDRDIMRLRGSESED